MFIDIYLYLAKIIQDYNLKGIIAVGKTGLLVSK